MSSFTVKYCKITRKTYNFPYIFFFSQTSFQIRLKVQYRFIILTELNEINRPSFYNIDR